MTLFVIIKTRRALSRYDVIAVSKLLLPYTWDQAFLIFEKKQQISDKCIIKKIKCFPLEHNIIRYQHLTTESYQSTFVYVDKKFHWGICPRAFFNGKPVPLPDKSSRCLGSLFGYSAQTLFIAYLFIISNSSVGWVETLHSRTATQCPLPPSIEIRIKLLSDNHYSWHPLCMEGWCRMNTLIGIFAIEFMTLAEKVDKIILQNFIQEARLILSV